LLKEELRCIFEKIDTREKAHKFLTTWVVRAQFTGNKHLSKFLTTLKNWWNEILNYFIENTTNGFVEGLNGVIRNIIRTYSIKNDSVNLFWNDAQIRDPVSENLTGSQNCIAPEASFARCKSHLRGDILLKSH